LLLDDLRLARIWEQHAEESICTEEDKVIGGWKKLDDKELHNFYSSPAVIGMIMSWRMRWAGHVSRMLENRNANSILMGKPEGKRPLRRHRRRWENIIKTDF
jgi:hypothetical protein